MGEEDLPEDRPAPAVTVERKSGSQIGLALTVLALVLASNSIINESWLTTSQEIAGDEINADYSLTEVTFTNTATGEEEAESYESVYNDCKDLEGKEVEEDCAKVKDYHNAGFVAIILLIVSSVILLIGSVMQVKSMIGTGQRASNLISAMGGIFVGISILVWWIMLPETDLELDWGQGLWMVTIAASCGLVAGFSSVLQSWIDGPSRMRAHGVRSGTDMKEFVLKESSCGDKALSILVDSDLIRVARISRIGASPSVEDILATRRDSYTGFSHQRLDWLDDFKGVWWVVAGASLISSFMISALFLIPFTIAALLALLQLMDPERFVVSTNSGNHPFYINRWRSNRELTDLAMDLVDDAMISVLRGGDLETEKLDARAELIANRFTVNMKAQQMAEKLAAAEKEAKRQAAEAAAAAQQIAMMEAQQKAAEQHAAMMQAQQMTPGQQIAMAEASGSQPNQPTPPGMQSAMMQTTPIEQMPMQSEEPAVENQESTEGDDQPEEAVQQEEVESNGDEGSDEISDTTEEIEDTNTESEQKQSEAEQMPQTSQEETPVVIPPPPSTTAMIPPPPTGPPLQQNPAPPVQPIPAPPAQQPMTIPAPPVQQPMTIPAPPALPMMPPPPGMSGAPGLLPPMGNPILPPMATPQPMSPPPPVLVQGSPREENLTDDEKDDLLGDLNE